MKTMARALASWLALASLVSVCGCSWLTNLVVHNGTSTEVLLSYRLKPQDFASPDPETGLLKGYRLEPPRLVEMSALKSKWATDFPEARYSFDRERGLVTVPLQAGQTVWIDMISNYKSVAYARGAQEIKVDRLSVRRNGSESVWEGEDLMKAFKKYHFLSDSTYVLDVE